MSTSYPGSVDANTGPNLYNNRAINTGDPANDHNNLVDATIAVQSKLGAGASLPTVAGQVLTATGTGSSWSTLPGSASAYKVVGQSNADVLIANNGNIGAALNTLTTSMIADGKYGTIYVKRGVYTVETPIILKAGVNIVGDGTGDGGTVFIAKNGLNDDVFRTDGFSDQTNHNYVGYDAKAKYIRLENFEVRGNSANQTASGANDPSGMRTLVKLYGYKLWVHNLMLRDAAETAFYSEFSNNQPQTFENYETLPNVFDLIDIKGYTTYGFVYRGPHDSYLNRIFAATSGANIAGMLFDQGTNYGLANTHIFESYANGNASIANVLIKGNPSLTGRIYAEGAQNAPAFDITGSACDMDLIAGYVPTGVVIRGNSGNSSRNRWRVQFFYDEPPVGIKLDGNVQYNHFDLTGAFPDTTVFDTSTYTGGNNTFKGRVYGAKMFSDGTKVGNTDIVEFQSDNYPDSTRVSNFSWPVADTSFKLLSTGTDKYVDAGGLQIRNTAKGVNPTDSASVNQLGKARNTFNVLDYGAKGDARRVQYIAVASGTNTVTCNQANFTASDVGKILYAYREYPDNTTGTGAAFITTITAVTDSSHATVAANAAMALDGSSVTFAFIGTDDSAAIQSAILAATLSKPSGQFTDPNNPYGAGQSEVYIPPASTSYNGIYLIASQISVKSTVRLDAPGMLVNVMTGTNATTTPFIIFESYSSAKKLMIEAGYNSGIQLGNNNGWQTHVFIDDISIWHTGNAAGQNAITLLGYDHHFKKIYLKNANVGVYHASGSDFSCDLLFAIGCVTAVQFVGSSQAHYTNILSDTGRGPGIIVNGGSGNIYANIHAFEAANTTFVTSPVLQIGNSSTTVNRGLKFEIQAICTGGIIASIANVKDTTIEFNATNTATLYGAAQAITTGVAYGANVDTSVSIKGHMSTGITPYTGTQYGAYEYTQGAGRTFSLPISMSANKISNLADPTSAQDAATKAYVDANAGGGGGTVTPDATTTAKGKIQLAGDFDPSSTAAVPRIAFANDTIHTLKAGDTFTGTMNTQTMLPSTTATYSVGSSTAYYQNLYATNVYLNGTASISGSTAGVVGITGSPAIASGGQIRVYNTADQTTSYESLRIGTTSNVWQILAESGGSGVVRPVQIGTSNGYMNIVPTNSGGLPKFQLYQAADTTASIFNLTTGTFNLTASNVEQYLLNFTTNIKQTGTANYSVFKTNVVETSVGSGTNYLILMQVGGATRFSVDTAGNVTSTGVRKDRIVTSSTATSFTPNCATTDVHRATLTGNNTLNVPSGTPVDEQKLTVECIQDSTGSRTLTLASGYYIPPSVAAPTLSTAAGSVNILGFRYNGVLAKWVYFGLI